MKAKFYLYLAFLIVIFSCTKCKDKTPPPIYYLPQEVKDYMYFQPGTYWVYKDSASGVLDSVIVTETNIEMFSWVNPPPNNDKITHIEERFSVKTFSFYESFEYVYNGNPIGGTDCNQNNVCAYVQRDKMIPNVSGIGTTYALYYPFVIGLKAATNGLTVQTIIAKYDSLSVGGKYYKDVVEYHETRNATENNHVTYFYVARNYGIIKKIIFEFTQWHTWELIRSNIIK